MSEPLYDPGSAQPMPPDLLHEVFPVCSSLLAGFAAMLEDETDRELIAWTLGQRYAYARRLDGGRIACVAVMTYGKGRLCLATETDILDGW
jgi:hypothetical protein